MRTKALICILSSLIIVGFSNVEANTCKPKRNPAAENLTCTKMDPMGSLKEAQAALAPIAKNHLLPKAEIATTSFRNDTDMTPLAESSKKFSDEPPANLVIDINSEKKYQEMWGFGASITESCLHNMKDLSPRARRQMLENLFSTSKGAGLNYVRIPVGANDFSMDDYTPGDTPGNVPDPEFKHFNFKRERQYASFIREVKAINPEVKVMMSPWTPPAWMKDPAHLRGGQVKKEYLGAYADYIMRILEEYKKEGVDMHQLTVMNEPLIGEAQTNWYFPQGYMSPEDQQEFIGKHLGPKLLAASKRQSNKIETRVLLHDHNWDNSGYAADMMKDSKVKKVAGGIAYHCYGGNLSDMQQTMSQAPGVPAFQTECTATLGDDGDSEGFHWWMYNQSLDAVRAGSSGSLAWNLCLDQKGEPKNDGCDKCRGLVTIDKSKNNAMTYNREFWALAQTSKYLRAGAVRIDSTDLPDSGVSNVAFLNPDGSKVMVMRNDRHQEVTVSLRNENCQVLTYKIPARGAVSMRWKD